MSNLTIGQIIGLRNGLDPLLAQLQAVLSVAYAQTLPLIGKQLSTSAAAGQAELKKFKAFEDKVAAALDVLNDPAGYAAQQLNDAISTAITQAGFAGLVTVTVGADGTLALGVHDTASATYQQALGVNFGIPNLSLVTSGTATATIGYSVNFDATVDTSGTFMVADPSKPALSVNLDVTTPTFTADATLSSLRFHATDNGSGLHGAFTIDGTGKATFTGSANLGVHLESDLGSGAFPSLSADLTGSYSFTSAPIDPANTATFGDKPTIGFSNVKLDIGSFFTNFLKPALDAVKPILAPLHTAVAVLNTDLTFLKGILGPAWHVLDTAGAVDKDGKDIGDGRVTLLDLIKDGAARLGNDIHVGGAQSFINDLDVVLQAIAFLDSVTLGPSSYNLGSFTISDDVRAANFSAANATLAKLGSGVTVQSLLGGLGGPYAAAAGNGYTGSVSDALLTILSNKILSFPILDPTNMFNVLLGRTADLFNFNPTPFTFGTGTATLIDVPVFPLIDIVVNGALSATAGIGFGVDTKGLLDYAAGGYSDPGKLLDGLYVTNPVVNGAAAPVLQIAGRIGIGVALGIPGLQVVGTGGVGGEVDFSLANTGKNYLGPLISQLASDPLSAFDATGKLTAGFEIGTKILGVPSYSYDSPTVTLLSYNHHVTPVVGVQPAVFSRIVVTSIDGDTTKTTGREVINDTIRFTVYFSKGVTIIAGNPPVMTLNDGGTATLNEALSKDTGTLVFDYTVLPSDTSIKTLGVVSISSQVHDSDGLVVGFADAAGYQFQNVSIDTAQPLNFTAPTGLFNDKTNFNRAFVSVSSNGQDLTLYGNAIVNSGSVATFQQDSGDVNTLNIQQDGTLSMTRGVLRVNSLLDHSTNAGTIQVGPAELRIKLDLKNTGSITLGAVGGTPTLTFLNGQTQLTGGGTIVLSDSAANLIGGGPTTGDVSALPVLTNVDNTISGAGTIGGYAADGSTGLDLVNKATITGTGTNKLVLRATTKNLGTLAGTGSGGLSIQGTVDNIAGTIAAISGGVVTLGDKADVTGGTLSTPGGADTARFLTAGLAAIHGKITQNAFIQVGASATLQVTGEIDQARYAAPTANSARLSSGGGTLQFIGAQVYDGYIAGAGVTVTGSTSWVGSIAPAGASGPGFLSDATVAVASTGVLSFGGVTANRGVVTVQGTVGVSGAFDNTGGTLAATGTGHLTLSTATVTGGTLLALAGGSISLASGTTLIGGTVTGVLGATPSAITTQGRVTLDGSTTVVTNTGSLHATSVAGVSDRAQTLHLTGTINQYTTAQTGELVADDADVVLDNATLQNGTLRTVGSGQFVVNANSVLDGTSHGLNLPGALTITSGQSLAIRGLIVNASTLTIAGNYYSGVSTLIASGAARLTGAGTVRLVDTQGSTVSDRAVITGAVATDSLENVDNLITGYGELGNGRLVFVNDAAGVVTATDTTLRIATGAGSANQGLMQATTGRLLIEASLDNTSGRIVAAGNTVQLGGDGVGAGLKGGTLATVGQNLISVNGEGAVFDGTGQAVTNTGTLSITSGVGLTMKGTLVNAATVAIGGNYYNGGAVLTASGAVVLRGGGTVKLLDTQGSTLTDRAAITGVSVADTFDNIDNAITGYGELGAGKLSFVNEAAGTVTATDATLLVWAGATVVNHGLFQATTGTLAIQGVVDNTGAVIRATQGAVVLAGQGRTATLIGGTLSGVGGVAVSGEGATFDGTRQALTNTAAVAVTTGTGGLTVKGTLVNAGSIALNGNYYNGGSYLKVSGAVTLRGGGSVAMLDTQGGTFTDRAVIQGASTADVLDNVDNVIAGYGELGLGKLSFVNEAAGVVNAATAALTLDTGVVAAVNHGLMEATTGTLVLNTAVTNTDRILAAAGGTVVIHAGVANSGTIRAVTGGTLVLSGAVLAGTGTLSSALGSQVSVAGNSTIDGTSQAVSQGGTLSINSSVTLTLKGAMANSGVLAVSGNYYNGGAVLAVSGTTTLSGGGTVKLLDTQGGTFTDRAAITGVLATDVLDNVDEVISGYGQLGAGKLTFINEAAGVVTATDSTLQLWTGRTIVNHGLLQATTGTLAIQGVVDNTGALIKATAGSVILAGQGRTATVIGGTLAGAGGIVISGEGVTFDGTGQAVTNATVVGVTTGSGGLTAKGTLVNTGSIAVNGNYYNGNAFLTVSGTVRLTGGGSVAMLDTQGGALSDRAVIQGVTGADVLDNVDNVIAGYGTLGSGKLSFINEAGGTVTATSGTLRLWTGQTVVNHGLMQATTGTLLIEGVVDNTGGSIKATSGGVVLAGEGRGARLIGGTLSGPGGVTVSGEGAVFDGTGQALTNAAAVGVGTGNGLTVKGTLANTGTIAVNGNYYGGAAFLKVSGVVTLRGGGSIALLDTQGGAFTDRAVIQGDSTADVLDNLDNVVAGYGELGYGRLSFVNEAAGVVNATGSHLALNTGAALITNRGLLEATTGALDIVSAVANSGTIQAAGGIVTVVGVLSNTGTVLATAGTVGIGAGDTTNLVGGTLTGGTWAARGGTIALADALTTDAATIVLDGAGSVITANGADLAGSLTGISAGGSLQVLGGLGWAGTKALSNAGEIRLGGGTFAATSIANTGRIDGAGTINAAITGTGIIEAAGGTLTLAKQVSGALLVDAGSTMVVKGGAAAGTTLRFAGPGATLQIVPGAGAQPFNGRVIGSTAGDTINLVGIAATGTNAGSTLTLSYGGATIGTVTFDTGYVGSLASDGHGGTLVTAALYSPDPLFDTAYYLAQNPDVAAAGIDPYQHYMTNGWREGRNPSALFNTNYYLNQNPDVRAAGLNPLAQFEATGWLQGRDPSIGFSVAAYLAAYPDVRAAGLDPLVHYVTSGKAEGRIAFAATPHPTGPEDPLIDAAYVYAHNPGVAAAGLDAAAWYHSVGWRQGADPSALFSTAYYLNQNGDVKAAGIDPLAHFAASGWREGRDPSVAFSLSGYLTAYPDVRAAGLNPLAHYIGSGKAEGRTAFAAAPHTSGPQDPMVDAAYVYAHNPAVAAAGLDAGTWYHSVGWTLGANPDALFDTNYYLTQNLDVRAAGIDPLAHFEANGWKEGREPGLAFNDAKYLSAYPDIRAAGIDPLQHYLQNGQFEGRLAFLAGGSQASDPLVDAAYFDRQLGATIVPAGLAGARQAAYAYDHGGWQRGLNPSALFDTMYYLSHNPDVAAAHIDPLAHYEANGWKEGRDPSAAFSTTKYLAAYGDVRAAGIDPLAHYVQSGQAEGRTAFSV